VQKILLKIFLKISVLRYNKKQKTYHSSDYKKLNPLKKGLKNKVEYKSVSSELFLKYIFHIEHPQQEK